MDLNLNLAKTTLEQGITFVRNAGLQVVELRPGYVKCLMPFRNNGNHIGSMYAGALFTVAEIPGGALFLSSFDTSKYLPIVKVLNLNFLKPAKSDVTVEISMTTEQIAAIQAEADSKGKAEFVLKGELQRQRRRGCGGKPRRLPDQEKHLAGTRWPASHGMARLIRKCLPPAWLTARRLPSCRCGKGF